MKLGIKRALVMGLGAVAIFTTQAVPAGAANAVTAVVQGSGNISPGLGLAFTPQNFTFTSATITTVGIINNTPTTGSSDCFANGSSDIANTLFGGENEAVGAGTGTWNCVSGPLAGKSGLLTYTRVGVVVHVSLKENAGTISIGLLVCVFVPTGGTPVTSYDLTCTGTLVTDKP